LIWGAAGAAAGTGEVRPDAVDVVDAIDPRSQKAAAAATEDDLFWSTGAAGAGGGVDAWMGGGGGGVATRATSSTAAAAGATAAVSIPAASQMDLGEVGPTGATGEVTADPPAFLGVRGEMTPRRKKAAADERGVAFLGGADAVSAFTGAALPANRVGTMGGVGAGGAAAFLGVVQGAAPAAGAVGALCFLFSFASTASPSADSISDEPV
jgi:hypothetical protein